MENINKKLKSGKKKIKTTVKKLNEKRNKINNSVIKKTKKLFKISTNNSEKKIDINSDEKTSEKGKGNKFKPSTGFINAMINRNLVDTLIHKMVLAELNSKYPNLTENQLNEKADKLTDDIMSNPLFLEKLIKFEEDSESYALNDGVATLKDALAFIPEAGALADVGIDVVTKYLPQTYFTYQNIESIKDIYNDSMSQPIDFDNSDEEKKTISNSSPTFADRYKKAISEIKYQ